MADEYHLALLRERVQHTVQDRVPDAAVVEIRGHVMEDQGDGPRVEVAPRGQPAQLPVKAPDDVAQGDPFDVRLPLLRDVPPGGGLADHLLVHRPGRGRRGSKRLRRGETRGLGDTRRSLPRREHLHQSIAVVGEPGVGRIDRREPGTDKSLVEAGRPLAAQVFRVLVLLRAPVQARPAAGWQLRELPQDGADAHPLVRDPVDRVVAVAGLPCLPVPAKDAPLVVGLRHPAVVERDDLPLIVEDRGAGIAGLGVRLVVEEVVEPHLEHVVADGDLLQAPHRVADHVDRLAYDQLARLDAEPVPAERLTRRPPGQVRGDHDQGEVQALVDHEERVRVQLQPRRRLRGVVDGDLGVELDEALPGRLRVGEHMLVGHQQARRHQEAGAQREFPAVLPYRYPGHGSRRPGPTRQEAPRLQFLGHPEDAFIGVGRGQRFRAHGLHGHGGGYRLPVQQTRGARGERLP